MQQGAAKDAIWWEEGACAPGQDDFDHVPLLLHGAAECSHDIAQAAHLLSSTWPIRCHAGAQLHASGDGQTPALLFLPFLQLGPAIHSPGF